MWIAVCLDDRDGMLFNRRRQSMDSALRDRLLGHAGNSPLWMNGYSAAQFLEKPDNLKEDERFLENAGPDDLCFVENADISAYADQIRGVIIYRWNRVYPSDVKFPMELFSCKWRLVSSGDFPGSSHERITEEVYAL